MVNLLVLQAWHGLSDPELERQVVDRISFMKFLGIPETIPDYTTVWYFRERLAKAGKDGEIWDELQRQLDVNNMKVKEGVMQDAFKNPRFLIARKFYEFSTATFITSDPGHDRADKPRGPKNPEKQGRNLG